MTTLPLISGARSGRAQATQASLAPGRVITRGDGGATDLNGGFRTVVGEELALEEWLEVGVGIKDLLCTTGGLLLFGVLLPSRPCLGVLWVVDGEEEEAAAFV